MSAFEPRRWIMALWCIQAPVVPMGHVGINVLLAPPYNVLADEIDLIVEKLAQAVDRGLPL